MAKKQVVVAKKKAKVVSTNGPEKPIKKGSPIVIFVPRKLKGMLKLAAIASGDSISTAFREWAESEFIPAQKKAIAKLVSDTSKVTDDDEDEVEDTDTDEAEVEEDEDEEEEEEDEDEDEE